MLIFRDWGFKYVFYFYIHRSLKIMKQLHYNYKVEGYYKVRLVLLSQNEEKFITERGSNTNLSKIIKCNTYYKEKISTE